ncbi:VWA domain-containing protein [Vibrio sp. Of7-15]|uniref:vWA domain-containing protein n=1 Tax=Vibrio sp. Of7-15 TaxID=2724879 RepID=UPI001EF307FB|nr:VWA domain-containing protein [Vibrio sp. Of7-15]MCG7498102.1 VWA domain-containing protein [Vibrio sp. Of7-15]
MVYIKKIMLAGVLNSVLITYGVSADQSLTLPPILDPNLPTVTTSVPSHFVRTGPTIQIAIALDSSGSMEGLSNQAKQTIWKIINEVSKANKDEQGVTLQVGLFEYGISDMAQEGHIQLLSHLTNDLDTFSEQMSGMRVGGSNEFGPKVVLEAVNRLAWSDHPDDMRLMIVAGNEIFQQGDVAMAYAIDKAKRQGIIVNTVYCGDYSEGVQHGWQKVAARSGGKYMNIDQDEKLRVIATPFDKEIIELGERLNETYVAYGASGMAAKSRQRTQDQYVQALSESAYIERNVAKTSKSYKADNWDLVSVAEKDITQGILLAKEAPEFTNKTEAQIKTFLEEKLAIRNDIKDKIAMLKKKRDQYLVTESKTTTQGDFGQVLIDGVKEQAQEQGYLFK